MTKHQDYIGRLKALYDKPLPSSRTGPLYNAFSYPTKISPEAIAVFIATHTKPGSVVLDAFAGSGSTGLATLLCDRPTDVMKQMATELGVEPMWGRREAHLFEIGTLGSFVARTLCNPPEPEAFAEAAAKLFAQAQSRVGWIYGAKDPEGCDGFLRHAIWSDVIVCAHCQAEVPYWDATVRHKPLKIADTFVCPSCRKPCVVDACARAVEIVEDDLVGEPVVRKKRVLAQVYGQSGTFKWRRAPTDDDRALFFRVETAPLPAAAPKEQIVWGDLRRAGYHKGITHLHHFYTRRNFLAMSTLWELVCSFPNDVRDALRLLVLSYNSSHSTLMTRVVVKKGQSDFVLTGAQSGVLYISGLPVEKNIFEGIARKAKAFKQAFAMVHGSAGKVKVHNVSSEKMGLPDGSIDYVFTDPPFGDYIPYAEINQINEIWLGSTTNRSKEIIVSDAQGKSVGDYGRMMGSAFREIARVLKPEGLATVVFHSAQSAVWSALAQAYGGAGLAVRATSVLDKLQASFKQVVSKVSVKGDPLLLLSKGKVTEGAMDTESVVQEILTRGVSAEEAERDPQRLYSRFVSRCLELGIEVSLGAKEFYGRAREAQRETP
jgi:16S rRNA G966 N2-methylase RsmD